ncbi:MAG: lipoyl synthase [Candidatus Omnitrophota bacterium]
MPTLKQPPWLKKTAHSSPVVKVTADILRDAGVSTVCQSARCPNIFDCFSRRQATFLILGERCTRRCGFCAVEKGVPGAVDPAEVSRVSAAVFHLGLQHVIITSVTRDDIDDGGAGHFARMITSLRKICGASLTIEVLTPDFSGNASAVDRVLAESPHIFSHNLETVPRLYAKARCGADYERSLRVLRRAHENGRGVRTKSSIMLGLGETRAEIAALLADLRSVGCDMLAVGQYLRPSPLQIPVERYIRPEEFSEIREMGYTLGFTDVQSGPFVRSSYRAREGVRDGDTGQAS